ncbi:holo-ACP synthase, partial [Nonomuraea angiospora]
APRGLAHLEAEVRRDERGKPELRITGKAAEVAYDLGVKRWHVSLSHDAGVAVAYVIAEG